MLVHRRWDPVTHAAEPLEQALAQAAGWPWGQGRDRDSLVRSYRGRVLLVLLGEGVNADLGLSQRPSKGNTYSLTTEENRLCSPLILPFPTVTPLALYSRQSC